MPATEPQIGQIMMVGFNFAPRGWALCDGQLLAINSNQALFSLLGTTYGGDGRTTFALPDLRGRVPLHTGQGTGLSPRPIGQKVGSETETLTVNHLPAHTHGLRWKNADANTSLPSGSSLAIASRPLYDGQSTPDLTAPETGNLGGGLAHDNMQPWLGIYHVIATTGTFPSRN